MHNLDFLARADAGVMSDQTRSIQDRHFQAVDSGAFGF
jgi:hypothetical protein